MWNDAWLIGEGIQEGGYGNSVKFKRLSFLAVLALVACSQSPLTDRDFIVEVHDKGQWGVSKAQAAEAKLALLGYLATSHPAYGEGPGYFERERPGIHAKISTFYLQYYGGLYDWTKSGWDDAGEQQILINGLCEILPEFNREMMHKQLVGVSDGGPCFFSAAYSPAQRKIVHFLVNGHA